MRERMKNVEARMNWIMESLNPSWPQPTKTRLVKNREAPASAICSAEVTVRYTSRMPAWSDGELVVVGRVDLDLARYRRILTTPNTADMIPQP